MSKIIAVIPARGGSKRLPRKNFLDFCGKPLYEYSVLAAKQSSKIDEIYVSTDSKEIIEDCNIKNYQMLERGIELASDLASTSDVILDIAERLSLSSGDKILILQPTSPLRSRFLVEEVIDFSNKITGWSSVISVTRTEQKLIKITDKNIKPVNYYFGQRHQDILSDLFYENGLIYMINVNDLLSNRNIFGNNPIPYVIDDSDFIVDIDELIHFEIAKLKYTFYRDKHQLV